MLSGVLRSDRAIAVNIEIMQAFVELRRVAGSYAALEKRLDRSASGSERAEETDQPGRSVGWETR